jgi:WD repeat-containing protein 68
MLRYLGNLWVTLGAKRATPQACRHIRGESEASTITTVSAPDKRNPVQSNSTPNRCIAAAASSPDSLEPLSTTSLLFRRMPLFSGHNRSASSTSAQQNAQHPSQGAATGLFQAAQALGSIGAPTGNLRTATSGTTTAGTDALYSPSSIIQNQSTGSQSAQSPNHTLAQANPASNTKTSSPATRDAQQFETPRRPPVYSRQSDELHLTESSNTAQRGPASPRDYLVAGPPKINLEQSTPETSKYQSGNTLPGALQSGGTNRAPPISLNTAHVVPTVPSTMSQDPFATPIRSANQNLSHNYSRSSPSTGYDGQNYTPYSSTPGGSELPQYQTPNTSKYAPGQQRTVSNTPLGLADIRPRADSNLSESLPGANPYSYDGANAVPTNSNYLAPWAIYAFDWCKWPAHNNDAGKVAVGSYLEDGHNFVSHVEHRHGLC